MTSHTIGIIGAGPVGSIMAAYLARNGEVIYIVDLKEELIKAIEKKGITLTGVGDSFTQRVKGTGTSISSLSRFGVKLIFVATKFTFLDSILEEIKAVFRPSQKLVLLQNGIDNEDRAARKLGEKNVLRFVVNYAGMIVEPGRVKMSFFHPPNYIGCLSPEVEPIAREIAEFITDAGLKTEFCPDVKKYEWRKTILNAAMMPVCAATGLTMKEAISFEHTRYLCEQILLESIEVAKKVGYEYEEDFFEKSMAYLSGAGHHKPSTSIDLEAGNPIEYIFQPIIDYGKKLGSPTPVLESLTRVVRTLEKKNLLNL
ncbi:MAG: ketopantoate reductase family protein [Candidatus Aminicenantales bacterium]